MFPSYLSCIETIYYTNDLTRRYKNELKNLRMQILGYFCHFLLHLTTYVLFFSHSLFSGIHE